MKKWLAMGVGSVVGFEKEWRRLAKKQLWQPVSLKVKEAKELTIDGTAVDRAVI